MSNIREIAERAGVSIATVSRYLNGTGYVSEEASLKIQREIDKAGYIPNALAKAIFTKKSKTIALMIPNITNPFFNQMATAIEEYCNKMGYTLFLCNTGDNKEKEVEYLEALKAYRVDGIIASRTQCKEEYLNIQIPVVSFENHISSSIITVSSDNYDGGKIAFNHLYEKGCRKILHIKGPEAFEATELRCKGFLEAAKEKGLEVDIVQFETDFHVKMLGENLNNIKNIEAYDGIFVFNDIAAAVVMRHLKEKNIKIPSQVQVIGFDDSFIGELLHPSLTTIRQPIKELGTLAAELLIRQIDGEKIPIEDRLIETKLIQRETTLS
ncbi:Periplasmic binding protein/LacI transcriptional regulator [[Clostridium] ultunense Esp]|uniref:Periplasmic binding protein/LacI transcriptional regulator n=1 Tax=[Clostridium] ultunense Esp TaxID=1288971 RepID=M1ZGN1_9FIRM|nr:LacI family DNA-binding transcriptional regulator [Schnuerera ultunensis]CCQ92942.1 Periplasmic binding protein/LacI transcriptional regulator [[Clostridium] ultunense Esp]SHD76427.1 Periplasmic binding protein/LacI transcriptional regulator [[Clostridium] ultunense Esp]